MEPTELRELLMTRSRIPTVVQARLELVEDIRVNLKELLGTDLFPFSAGRTTITVLAVQGYPYAEIGTFSLLFRYWPRTSRTGPFGLRDYSWAACVNSKRRWFTADSVPEILGKISCFYRNPGS